MNKKDTQCLKRYLSLNKYIFRLHVALNAHYRRNETIPREVQNVVLVEFLKLFLNLKDSAEIDKTTQTSTYLSVIA